LATPTRALKFCMNVACFYLRGAHCSSQTLTRNCYLGHNVGNGFKSISSPAMSLVVKEQNGILSQYLFSTIGLFYSALQGPYFV
jgi:hypothetical protein